MAKKGVSGKRKHFDFLKEKIRSTNDISWVEDFSPLSIDELCVHKKKISEVQIWLQQTISFTGGNVDSPILLLTGPPGSGKTAAVQVICKYLKADLFTWTNNQQEKYWTPNDGVIFTAEDFSENETQAAAFSRFLLHSAKYSLFSHSKRVILVEEFPNALLRSPGDFHSIIRKYAVSAKHPVVFIISDNTRGESAENRLFPKDLQAALKITNISFNPVAPTVLMKVLQRINSSSKVQSTYKKLGKSEIEDISANSKGDIRNAINTMQFMCITQSSQHGSKEVQSKDSAMKREASLFLFHALGKILYCKRDSSLKSEKDRLPEHMKHLEKDPTLENPEHVFEKTSISADGFNLFLQENHIPFVEDIRVETECTKWLSEADAICAEWSGREILNNYAVSLATRGLMFNMVSSTSGRRWRSLHKPHYYENNAKKNKNWGSVKNTFKGTGLSMKELQIDFIPFICKIKSRDFKPAQLSLAKEIGEMNVKRISRSVSRPLDEKDCFEPYTVDENGAEPDDNTLEIRDEIIDEEIVIEEYDF